MDREPTPGPGLALTPPMGWNTYNTFECEPNEQLLNESADAMIETGLKDAGYVYINIDDGWMAPERDADGNLYPDPVKFPNGLKTVTDYIHSKGLKAGIYLGCGIRTYGEKPGSLGYEENDAKLISDLNFDLLKYDYRVLPEDPPDRDVKANYMKMRDAMIKAGHAMVFSICEHGRSKPWEWGANVGHMWRTTIDMRDGFDGDAGTGWSFNKIIDNTHQLYPYAGPGHWNDPDMLIVGLKGKIKWHQSKGCTFDEYRTHFGLWCLSAAPLLIGCDIRNMDADTKDILMNREIIAVDQDILGAQGHIAKEKPGSYVWAKPLSDGAIAVGLYNRSDSAGILKVNWSDIGIDDDAAMSVRDLWKHKDIGDYRRSISMKVKSHSMEIIKLYAIR